MKNESTRHYRHNDIITQLDNAAFGPLDVLVCGSTGVGKSSTLNALFCSEVAECADGMLSCTQDVTSYMLNDDIRIWDTPGLGDGVEQDKRHIQKISEILQKTCTLDDKICYLIDVALVILDASGRDLHTPLTLIKQVLMPQLEASRIIVALNKADFACSGRLWDYTTGRPDSILEEKLGEKVRIDWERLTKDTGLILSMPVFFSAQHHFNINVLMDALIEHIPSGPRLLH